MVVKGLGRGGAEQLLVNQARTADHDRFDYHVAWVTPKKGDLARDLRDAGVTTHDLSAHRNWPVALTRLIDRIDPDVVHAHSPLLAVAVRLHRTVSSRAVALVYTEHNRWPMYRVPTRWANALTHRLDDRQFAVSQDVVDSAPTRRQPHLEVLHHGIDVAVTAAHSGAGIRAELGLPRDAPLIVTVANCRTEKDLTTLVAAAAVVTAESEATFVHVGSGPTEEAVHRAAQDAGLEDRLRFMGKRSDAVRFIAAADLFCLSSRHEGLPVTVMEALAVGTPVVATDVGGIGEAARHGREGHLVPPADPSSLAAAILDLLGDDARRAAMGASARERALEFDATRSTRVLEQAYMDLAAPRLRGGASLGKPWNRGNGSRCRG